VLAGAELTMTHRWHRVMQSSRLAYQPRYLLAEDSRGPLAAIVATSAAAGGASERAIMAQTGHRSTDVVRQYIREANLFAADNAASLAGL
jgi:hypothetical protein